VVDTKSTWPASHSVVHRFERSDGLLAELSSQTFWGWRASHHSTRPTAIDDCASTNTVLLPLPVGPMRRYGGGPRKANGSLSSVVETVVHGRTFTSRRSTTGTSWRKPIGWLPCARRVAAVRDVNAAGTVSRVPKSISSGVYPRNAECGRIGLSCWT
jgi:hypothetical protein